MTSVTVSNLDDDVVERLRRRAEEHRVSLEVELRRILTEAAAAAAPAARAAAWRERLAGRGHADSVELLREDRRR